MVILPIVLAAALAQAGPATPPADLHARVLGLLGAIDRPVSPEAFRALGAEGEAALAELARSRELPPFRARALEVLAALRSPGAEELHRALARDPAAPATVRRAAVRGLGGLLAPAPAVATLRPLLAGDPDAGVRAAAAGALARASPADGCAAVRRQAAREPAGTRAAFRRALAACEPGP